MAADGRERRAAGLAKMTRPSVAKTTTASSILSMIDRSSVASGAAWVTSAPSRAPDWAGSEGRFCRGWPIELDTGRALEYGQSGVELKRRIIARSSCFGGYF